MALIIHQLRVIAKITMQVQDIEKYLTALLRIPEKFQSADNSAVLKYFVPRHHQAYSCLSRNEGPQQFEKCDDFIFWCYRSAKKRGLV